MKRGSIIGSAIFYGVILLAAGASAESSDSSGIAIDTRGFLAIDEGQIVQGQSNVDPLEGNLMAPYEHMWQQRLFMQVSSQARINERLYLLLTLEASSSFSIRAYNDVANSLKMDWSVYPVDAAGRYSFGPVNNPFLTFTFGYMACKYNAEARNLGEYLFRTGTYPQWIRTDFEFPMARLLGFRLSSSLFDGKFTNDLFFTSEAEHWPMQDFSVSYIGSYTVRRFLEIGGGISLNHWFSVNERMTTPKRSPSDRYSIPKTDTTCDTGFYTFRGIKLMGRTTISPQGLFPILRELELPFVGKLFGKEDLKLYGEFAILGLKNYTNYIPGGDTLKDSLGNIVIDPNTGLAILTNKHWVKDPSAYYDELYRRIPIMFGFNIPTLRALDLLTIEFEYFPGKFPSNSSRADFMDNDGLVPLPFVPGTGDQATWSKWKWSVYARRSFSKHFSIIGLLARDHMRPITHHTGNRQDVADFLAKAGQYWWTLRLKADF